MAPISYASTPAQPAPVAIEAQHPDALPSVDYPSVDPVHEMMEACGMDPQLQVDVRVRFQDDGRDEKNFIREVDLVCRERATVVCTARTDVRVEDEEIRRLLREREIGLGQIIELLRVPTRFELEEAGVVAACFWRVYALSGAGFSCRVREEFPAGLYPEA